MDLQAFLHNAALSHLSRPLHAIGLDLFKLERRLESSGEEQLLEFLLSIRVWTFSDGRAIHVSPRDAQVLATALARRVVAIPRRYEACIEAVQAAGPSGSAAQPEHGAPAPGIAERQRMQQMMRRELALALPRAFLCASERAATDACIEAAPSPSGDESNTADDEANLRQSLCNKFFSAWRGMARARARRQHRLRLACAVAPSLLRPARLRTVLMEWAMMARHRNECRRRLERYTARFVTESVAAEIRTAHVQVAAAQARATDAEARAAASKMDADRERQRAAMAWDVAKSAQSDAREAERRAAASEGEVQYLELALRAARAGIKRAEERVAANSVDARIALAVTATGAEPPE